MSTLGSSVPSVLQVRLRRRVPYAGRAAWPRARAGARTGTFRLEWSTDELVDATIADADGAGFPPAAEIPDFLHDLATDLAGDYAVTFAGGRFDIALDTMEESFCTGPYSIRDDRIWLESERGWCVEVKFFDAAFELSEGELRFAADDFCGEWPYKITFATRPLDKID